MVKPRRAAVAGTVAQRLKANVQIAVGWQRAKALDDVQVPANTVYMGVGGKETLLDFLPATQTVPAGTVVDFVNMSPERAQHNALFGDLDWFLAPFNPATEPRGPPVQGRNRTGGPPFYPYGSDPAGADGVYTYAGAGPARQRHLRHAARGRPAGRPAERPAGLLQGEIHDAGDVSLHLPAPRPRHGR